MAIIEAPESAPLALPSGGTIAPAVVRDLAESEETSGLVLLDVNEGRATAVAREHGHGGARVQVRAADVAPSSGEFAPANFVAAAEGGAGTSASGAAAITPANIKTISNTSPAASPRGRRPNPTSPRVSSPSR